MKLFITALITMMALSSSAQTTEGSPFTDIRCDSFPSVKVEVSGTLYYLLSINGVRRKTIMKTCERTLGEDCKKMFAENFAETMAQLGMPVENTVSLRLYYMGTHSVSTVRALLTKENQELIIQKRNFRGE